MLEGLKEGPGALSVALVGEGAISALNRRFRGRSCPTDVLSFSYGQAAAEGVRDLGEVVISPVVASRQAGRWGTSAEAEMKRLIVHGILHLLGYDHEADRGEMMNLQRRLLRRRAIVRCGPILSGAAGR